MSASNWEDAERRKAYAVSRRSYDDWLERQRITEDDVAPLLDKMADTSLPVQLAMHLLKYHLRRLVPPDFEWRFEVAAECSFTVAFRSRLLPDAPWHRVGDSDFAIMLMLLESENWDQWRSELEALAATPQDEGSTACVRLGLSPDGSPRSATSRPEVAAGVRRGACDPERAP